MFSFYYYYSSSHHSLFLIASKSTISSTFNMRHLINSTCTPIVHISKWNWLVFGVNDFMRKFIVVYIRLSSIYTFPGICMCFHFSFTFSLLLWSHYIASNIYDYYLVIGLCNPFCILDFRTVYSFCVGDVMICCFMIYVCGRLNYLFAIVCSCTDCREPRISIWMLIVIWQTRIFPKLWVFQWWHFHFPFVDSAHLVQFKFNFLFLVYISFIFPCWEGHLALTVYF